MISVKKNARLIHPNNWVIIQGEYHSSMKLYMLPTPKNKYWFGYDPLKKQFIPDMIAISN